LWRRRAPQAGPRGVAGIYLALRAARLPPGRWICIVEKRQRTNAVAEAFDAWRKERGNVGEELADIAIYLFSLSEMLGFDLQDEIAAKIARNAARSYHRLPNDVLVKSGDDESGSHPAETTAAAQVGARLVTVLDEDYPPNLRLIPNLPPFLFYRGSLAEDDARSVAVVGTRSASPAGIDRSARLSRLRIIEAGALVSQFWPTRSPGKDTFPRRNVVASGLSQGTVVIEATARDQHLQVRRCTRMVAAVTGWSAVPWPADNLFVRSPVRLRPAARPAGVMTGPGEVIDREPESVEGGDGRAGRLRCRRRERPHRYSSRQRFTVAPPGGHQPVSPHDRPVLGGAAARHPGLVRGQTILDYPVGRRREHPL